MAPRDTAARPSCRRAPPSYGGWQLQLMLLPVRPSLALPQWRMGRAALLAAGAVNRRGDGKVGSMGALSLLMPWSLLPAAISTASGRAKHAVAQKAANFVGTA